MGIDAQRDCLSWIAKLTLDDFDNFILFDYQACRDNHFEFQIIHSDISSRRPIRQGANEEARGAAWWRCEQDPAERDTACRDGSDLCRCYIQIVATAKTEKQSGKTPPPEAVLRDILEM